MWRRRVLLPAPTKPTRSVVSVMGRHGSTTTRVRLLRRRSYAAGHVDGHAGDEVSVAGGEEADHPCLVGRLGDPAERRAGDFLRLLVQGPLRPPRPDAFGQRQTWGDGVDGDAERPQLVRELPREGDDPALGRGVGAAAARADPPPG